MSGAGQVTRLMTPGIAWLSRDLGRLFVRQDQTEAGQEMFGFMFLSPGHNHDIITESSPVTPWAKLKYSCLNAHQEQINCVGNVVTWQLDIEKEKLEHSKQSDIGIDQ